MKENKMYANLSNQQLLVRINRKFGKGQNDDDEVRELFRRSKIEEFKVIPKYDTYELEYTKGGKTKT
jgi:hypothetical protein